MTKLAAIALLSAGIGASVVYAPDAVAEPNSQFCSGLAAAGYARDCATLTGLAKDVCTQFDRGADVDTVASKLDATTKDQGLSNYIVAGARVYFCPQRG
jgi:uncharacterized protein DUF732